MIGRLWFYYFFLRLFCLVVYLSWILESFLIWEIMRKVFKYWEDGEREDRIVDFNMIGRGWRLGIDC